MTPTTFPSRPAPLRRPGRALLGIPLLVLGLAVCAQSRPGTASPEISAPGALHLPTQIAPPPAVVPPMAAPAAPEAVAPEAVAMPEPAAPAVAQMPVASGADVSTHPVAPPPAAAVAPTPPLPQRVEGGREIIATQIREGLKGDNPSSKRLNIIVDSKSSNAGVMPGPGKPANPALNAQRTAGKSSGTTAKPVQAKGPSPSQSLNAIKPAVARKEPGIVVRARPVPSLKKPRVIPWSYHGEGGPDNWHKLKPEYALCGKGQRQSPIAIDAESSLRGPAEAIEFNYTPSRGTVTDTGYTVEVKVTGESSNTLTVRNSTYRLQDFHFHHPAEELVNGQNYPMSAHFVHRNETGQIAILTVLFETGAPNLLVNKVWTHMPLGVGDSVQMPAGLIDLNEVLPTDRRYFQYMGSLTTPPCTEGVLWLILKRPVSVSPEQLQLLAQLYPNNARPLQAHNNRAVRDATAIAPGAGRLAGYRVIELVPSPAPAMVEVEVEVTPAPAVQATPVAPAAAPPAASQ